MPGSGDHEAYDALLNSVYDAALAPDGWTQAVERAVAILGGRSGSLLFQDRSSPVPDTDVLGKSGYAEGTVERYASHFAAQDTRIAAILAAPAGTVMADEWQYDYAAFLRMPLYNEFYRPVGVSRGIGVRLFSDGRRTAVLSVFREPGRGSYEEPDLQLMKLLSPHLVRALQLKRQVDRAEASRRGLLSGLDRFPQAVLLLDGAGQVREMNAAAEELLSAPWCPLRLLGGRLAADVPAEDAVLGRAVHDAAVPGRDGPPPVVHLRARDGMALALMVVPVRRAGRFGAGNPPGTLVFAAWPGANAPDPVLLARQHGLSQAEAHVAAALAAGEGLNSIADRRGVSRATVRTQVKSVLAKTATGTQARLVAMLGRGLGMLRRL